MLRLRSWSRIVFLNRDLWGSTYGVTDGILPVLISPIRPNCIRELISGARWTWRYSESGSRISFPHSPPTDAPHLPFRSWSPICPTGKWYNLWSWTLVSLCSKCLSLSFIHLYKRLSEKVIYLRVIRLSSMSVIIMAVVMSILRYYKYKPFCHTGITILWYNWFYIVWRI